MATKLEKNIIRESTILIDNREIIITLTSEQVIKLKLKGLKNGEVSITILELFEALKSGNISLNGDILESPNKNKDGVMINLNDLRSSNIINGFDVQTMSKFDGIISDLIDTNKEINESNKRLNKK